MKVRDYGTSLGTTSSTVVGDLRVLSGIDGPGYASGRDILIHLPPGAFTSGRRYPV